MMFSNTCIKKCHSVIIILFVLSVFFLALPVNAQFETVSVPIDGSPSLRLCMTCHGAYGIGNESVGGPKLAGMEAWYLRKQLTDFRNGLRGNQLDYIPGYEMRDTVRNFTDSQINDIVMQVTGWPDHDIGQSVMGDVASGQALYQTCAACHGMDGTGNEALGAPALAERSDWYLLRQLKLYKSGYRGSHPDDEAGAQMRQMIQTLEKDADMEAVVSYISSLN